MSRARSFAYVTLAYLAALAAAWLITRRLGSSTSPLVTVAWADVVATVVVFAFSVGANNTSVYDPYWSVAPMAIAPYLATREAAAAAPLSRQLLVGALVVAWGLRLTWNWARAFLGLHHEDFRYADIRSKTGRGYWPASLAALHMFPTVQVYLGCMALWPALASARPLGWLDAVAALVTMGSLAIETVADEQLRAFRIARKHDDEILATGLWAFSRHPNYLGEIGFWWGLFLFGLAAEPTAYGYGAGALAITVMFVFASVPLLDARSKKRRPAYAEHMKRVPAIVPRPWRRG